MGKYDSGLTASAGGKDFEVLPEGVYIARCYQLIDLGVQETPFFNEDGTPKTAATVRFVWEILDKNEDGSEFLREDGKPFTIGQDFTNSLHEKSKLLPFLEGWRGKKFTPEELDAFELGNVLGTYCQIQVMHKLSTKGKLFPLVTTALPFKGTKPEAVNPNVAFNMMQWDDEQFSQLSKYAQEKVKESLTYRFEIEKREDNKIDGTKPAPPKDTVIEDIGDEPINLDDIPF
jgi:hypothetical protein